MGGSISLNWGNLNKFLVAMDDVDGDSERIRDYAKRWVCNTDGFDYGTCAMKPIADKLPTVADWFDKMNRTFNSHWHGVRGVIVANAKDLDLADGVINHAFLKLSPGEAPPNSCPDIAGAWAGLSIHPFEINLDAPHKPDKGVKDHGTFGKVDEGFSATRDKINDLIGGVNWCIREAKSKGVPLPIDKVPTLPEGSLEEAIVFPLSGDYLTIRQNANACTTTWKAMSKWGGNFSLLGAHVNRAIEGKGADGLKAQLHAYDLVMQAVGAGIGTGKVVYNDLALVSEEISVVVERVLVKMALKLTKLLSKLGSKLVPFFGWALFVEELIRKGWHAISDIYDDVKECIEMISSCKDLVDKIDKWAKSAAEKLDTFRQIIEAVQNLPGISDADSINALTADINKLEKKLKAVPNFNEIVVKAGGELGGALDDLDGKYPDQSSEDDHDGPVIVAPGPPGDHPFDPAYGGGNLNDGYGMTTA